MDKNYKSRRESVTARFHDSRTWIHFEKKLIVIPRAFRKNVSKVDMRCQAQGNWPAGCTREKRNERLQTQGRALSPCDAFDSPLSYLSLLPGDSHSRGLSGFLFPDGLFLAYTQSMLDYYVGVDVGGTKTEVCLLSLERGADFRAHHVLERKRMATGRTTSLPDFLQRLQELVASLLSNYPVQISELKGVGIGLPGSIEPQTCKMIAGSIPFFLNVPLLPLFRKALTYSGPLAFDNDANCFTLAEAYFGAGIEWAETNALSFDELCMVGIILGTGVGGGIFVRGELIRGRRGGAGEIGHTALIEAGHACYCGRFGCSEQYLSGPAFEKSYAVRASHADAASGIEIFRRIQAGDPLAQANLEHYREHLIKFLSNLSNTLDPHLIVLGGGMSQQPGIYEGISERLGKECFLMANPPDIVPFRCGDSSGVIGAALLSFAQISSSVPAGNT